METVLVCMDGKTIIGWNESVQPEEDASYCTWRGDFDGKVIVHGEEITHWMPLPKPPSEKRKIDSNDMLIP
jgi:hypothetical protein